MAGPDPRDLLDAVIDIARRADDEIMAHYRAGFEVREKADSSPVTVADEAAERLILAALKRLTPDIPAIAEEEVAAGHVAEIPGDRFWLVDPLDGTKEFIRRSDEFTVNIALIERRLPVLGVVSASALGVSYAAAGPGTAITVDADGARQPIAARPVPATGAVVLASRSHGDPEAIADLLRDIPVDVQRTAGSSLKFCLIAAGEADIYPRYGNTHEWDTAAGHAVLAAAGGSVRTLDGAELIYRKDRFLNPEFIARGCD